MVSESSELVHAFVQHRHDTNVSVAQPLPIYEVLLVAKETAIHAELGGDRT